MRTELYITSRLLRGKRGFSTPAVGVAIASVAAGLAVMILSVAVVTGFQQEIRDKVSGFGGHIRISGFENEESVELPPITAGDDLLNQVREAADVSSVCRFATKAAVVRAGDQIEGVVFKGYDHNYDWAFYKRWLAEGRVPDPSDSTASRKAMISRTTASRLGLKLHDPLRMYFIIEGEPQPRGRKLEICGIFETGLGELDKIYVAGNIDLLRKLNGWDSMQTGGVEVLLKDFSTIEKSNRAIYNRIGYDLNSETIMQQYPQFFDWLALLDMNVIIILVLMIAVSVMAMVSALLILIIEKTAFIGLMKSLGSDNATIRRIFLLQVGYILGLGLVWGNLLGTGILMLQQKTGFFRLPQESYFVSVVPVNLSFQHLLLTNLGTIIICMVILVLPSLIIARITPVKILRYG